MVQHDLTGTSRTPAWLNVASRTSRTSRILSLCSRPLCKDDAKGLTTDVNALLSGTPLPPSPSVDSLHSVPLEPRSQRGSRITQDEKAPLNHPVDPSPTTDSRPSAARFQGTLSSLCATAIPESNSSDSATGIPESSSSDNNGTQSGSLPADTLLFSDDWLSEFNQTFVENEEYFRLFPDDTKQQSPPHGSSSTAQNLEPLEDGAKQHATPDSSSAVQEAIEMFSAWMGQHAMEGPNFRQGCVNPAHLTIPPGQSSRFYAENDAPAVVSFSPPVSPIAGSRKLSVYGRHARSRSEHNANASEFKR